MSSAIRDMDLFYTKHISSNNNIWQTLNHYQLHMQNAFPFYLCVCVYMCGCVYDYVCVCVCVCERQTKDKQQTDRQTEKKGGGQN